MINSETFEQKQARELEEFKSKQLKQAELHKQREEARKKERLEQERFEKQQTEFIMSYGCFTEKQAEMIYARAWEEGHAYGYNEVSAHVEDLADWSEKLIKG